MTKIKLPYWNFRDKFVAASMQKKLLISVLIEQQIGATVNKVGPVMDWTIEFKTEQQAFKFILKWS